MIQLDTLTLFLLLEAIAVLTLAVVIGIWLLSRRKRRERQTVNNLINRLKKVEHGQCQELEESLREIQTLPDDKRRALIDEIMEREKALYRQIMKLFLERDLSLLGKLDERVRELTKPYHELLRDLPPGEDPATAVALAKAEEEIMRLKLETERLAEQLQVAVETIDDLSTEYTRMFAPDKTNEDMEASRRRILDTLRQNEHRLKHDPSHEQDHDDLEITLGDSP